MSEAFDVQKEFVNLASDVRKSMGVIEGEVEGLKSDHKEKLDKMFPRLEELDDKVNTIAAEKSAKEEQIKKLEENIEELQKKLYRAGKNLLLKLKSMSFQKRLKLVTGSL